MFPQSLLARGHTCRQVLAFLLCGENLRVSQTAVSNVSDAKAEHGMREEELGHCGKSGPAFVEILPQLHHIQNLNKKQWQQQARLRVKGN